MRKLIQLPIVQDTDTINFPNGAIKNETDTQDGTPVVRELYNDILVNIWKILDVTKTEATGDEDSEATQYQLLDALRKLTNLLNDVEQVLSFSGTQFSIPFDLSILPDKYVCIARATDTYVSGPSYTFKGSGVTTYPFSSPTGFNASDELLVVIDHSGVRAYSLSSLTSSADEVFTIFGLPLAFNNGNKMFYQESGSLLSDVPSVDYLENIIRVASGSGTLLVNDILIMQGYVLCFCYDFSDPDNLYTFWQFSMLDLSTAVEVSVTGASFGIDDDFIPYVYADGTNLYVTNGCNNVSDDFILTRLQYHPDDAELQYVSEFDVDDTFDKTSNAAIKNDLLYTLVGGTLCTYGLPSGSKTELGVFTGIIGNLFGFDGEIYFTAGEVSKKWF